jgi:hypothetical protein
MTLGGRPVLVKPCGGAVWNGTQDSRASGVDADRGVVLRISRQGQSPLRNLDLSFSWDYFNNFYAAVFNRQNGSRSPSFHASRPM